MVELLSREARILLAVESDSEIGILGLSRLLGVSERSVCRSMTNLVEAKLVRRTKVGLHHRYQVVKQNLEMHPDIQPLIELANLPQGPET